MAIFKKFPGSVFSQIIELSRCELFLETPTKAHVEIIGSCGVEVTNVRGKRR